MGLRSHLGRCTAACNRHLVVHPGLRAGLVAAMLWWAAWSLGQAWRGGASWHFFDTGAAVLSDLDAGSRAGLHVYAEHPVLQIGPVALATAWVLGQLSLGHGQQAAELLGSGLGVVVVLLVRRIAQQHLSVRGGAAGRALDRRVLVASACFAPVWLLAAVGLAHLDDVLALTLGVAAVALVQSRRPVWAGLAMALAVDSKPWALPFAVVLLALPSVRTRALAVLVAAAGVLIVWLPFFLADPHTVRAIHFTIANSPLSGLRFLDVTAPRTPAWDRPLQTVVGCTLAGVALWRGRSTGIVLLVMASRLALDPGTNRYYTAGLAVGALLWDLTGSRSRWPWWTLSVLVVLHAARWVPLLNPVHGFALVAFSVAAIVLVISGPAPPSPRDVAVGLARSSSARAPAPRP